jgi:hypothetical protein
MAPSFPKGYCKHEDKHHLLHWEDCEWAGALDYYQAAVMVYWTQI